MPRFLPPLSVARAALAAGIVALLPAAPLAARAKRIEAPVAAPMPTDFAGALRQSSDRELLGVYAARDYRPIWFGRAGELDPAAQRLQDLAATAWIDGVDDGNLPLRELTAALADYRRDGSPMARAHADMALSATLVALVRATRDAPAAAMTYEHGSLRPQPSRRADALWAAAGAPSLSDYVAAMRWLHPLYAPLREAALAASGSGRQLDPAVRANLERLRALPAPGKGRSILVDAANARLWMYEGDRVVDSMKVVVGKPETQTPMYAGYVRYAILNPYWNVPDNLVRGKIGGNAVSRGPGYLRNAGYQVLSDWSAEAEPVDPRAIDWRKVVAGETEVRLRQLPSAANAMGKVKFEFPNPLGIYLHDTPEKQLMLKDDRHFSNGCVRLEDAERLGRWLFGGAMPAAGSAPEQRVDLPELVPVYITYLTAQPEAGRIALRADPYSRDGQQRSLAASEGSASTVLRK